MNDRFWQPFIILLTKFEFEFEYLVKSNFKKGQNMHMTKIFGDI